MEQPDPAIAAADALEAAGDHAFGLMRLDGALLALPVAAIREVIPGQRHYSLMPVKTLGLRGAVSLRGTTIPVLDLRQVLGMSPLGDAEHVVVILRWQGRLIGLIADEVRGIARLREADLFELDYATMPSGQPLATHTFQTGEDVATVLSAERIASLPNLPMVTERAAAKAPTRAKPTESILLFTCGTSHFGVDATFVDATVPTVRIERTALTSGFCLGVIDHHGFEVPAIATRDAIGIGYDEPRDECEMIVLRFGPEAMLGFAIDSVREIARVAPADIRPIPPCAGPAATLFRGMLADAEGREHLLIDMERVRAEPRFLDLARLRKPKLTLRRDTPVQAGGSNAAANAKALLTYVAGAERATELTQVSAIITYPLNIASFGDDGTGMLGLFSYRGRVVPLVCLATVLGRPCDIDPDEARVLIVDDGRDMLGFVVEALRSIETASWHSPPPGSGRQERGIFQSLVLVGLGETRKMLSHVDLMAQVRRFALDADDGELAYDRPAGRLDTAS